MFPYYCIFNTFLFEIINLENPLKIRQKIHIEFEYQHLENFLTYSFD